MFEGEEEDTLVGLQNRYTAACVCETRWLEKGILDDFPSLPLRISLCDGSCTYLEIIPKRNLMVILVGASQVFYWSWY